MQRGFEDSNWVNQLELTVFECFNGNVSAECAALSLSLRSQGRLAAAARMMVKQLSERDVSSVETLYRDAAAFCDELDATDLPALLYQSAYTRLSVIDYAPQGSSDLVDHCWSAIMVQLRNLAGVFGTNWSTFAPRLLMRLQINGLKQSSAAPAEVAAALVSIADRSIDGGDYVTATQALLGAVSASKTLESEATDQNSADLLRENLMRLLDLHRQTTKSLYFEVAPLLELLLLTDLKIKTHEVILNEVTEFDDRAPLFEVPVLCEGLYSAAMNAARETGQDELLETYDRAHDKAVRQSIPEEQVPTGIVQVITMIQKDCHDILDLGRNAIEIALMWAKEEYHSDMMTQSEWEELFGFYVLKEPERHKRPAFLKFLEYVQQDYQNISKSFFDASREDWVVRFSRLRGWLMESNDRIPGDSRCLVLSTIADAWVFKQRSDWAKQTHTDEENAGFSDHVLADIALANEIRSISQEQAISMVGLPKIIVKKDENVFRVISQIKANLPPGGLNAVQSIEQSALALDQAIQDSEDVFQEYQKRQNYLGMFTILRRQAEFLWDKFARFKSTRPEDAIAVLSRAEKVYDEVRRKRSVPLAQYYSITGKMQLLHKYDAGEFYDKAICWSRIASTVHHGSLLKLQKNPIAAAGGEAAREKRQSRLKELETTFRESYRQFVSWTQKSKSREIFDFLSIDSPIPRRLLEECNQDLPTADMIRRERELIQKLAQSPLSQLLNIKEELDELRGEMRQHSLLKNVMRIRDGETINLRGITEMLEGLPNGVVLVDFIYVNDDKPLRALCYRKGLTYSPALMYDVSMDILTAWTKNLAKAPKMPLGNVTSGRDCLSELTPILLPLFKVGRGSPNQNLGPVIRPGDTIVFCATGVLHKLPLHAIPIDSVPIIEKHPVVYCPSLTVLQHCLQMSKNPQCKDSVPRRLVLNPMPSYWDKAKFKPVQSTPIIKHTADTLRAKYIHGYGFSKHLIIDSLNDVSIFHYHGHIQFEKESAMKSYLVLDEVSKDNDTDDDGLSSEKRLSAEDVFSCKLMKGALATLVGCRGGGVDVAAADDVLGISMAMYYAGAAATVSSLWRQRDEDGAAWANAFYNDMHKQRREFKKEGTGSQSNSLVNLALAMQRAVRCLRFDVDGKERAPYHWAGYVLNGSWMFSYATTSAISKSSREVHS
jgi:CHAT domain